MRKVFAWAVFVVLCASAPLASPAAMVADPQTLYATMKSAFDKGAASGWGFRAQEYYYSTILNDRGTTYGMRGETERAIADFDAALKADGKNAVAFNNRGFAQHIKGDADRAIADFSEAIRLKPAYMAALYNRANAYLDKRDYDRAIKDFNAAITLNGNFAAASTCGCRWPTPSSGFANRASSAWPAPFGGWSPVGTAGASTWPKAAGRRSTSSSTITSGPTTAGSRHRSKRRSQLTAVTYGCCGWTVTGRSRCSWSTPPSLTCSAGCLAAGDPRSCDHPTPP